MVITPLLSEHHSEYGKLHQHGDTHYNDGCYEAMYTEIHTCREEYYMQNEIHRMASGEAYEPAQGRGGAESEPACKVEVEGEADNVTYNVGHACSGLFGQCLRYIINVAVDGEYQYQVHTVVNGGREAAVDDKPYKLCLAGVPFLYFLQ